MSRTKNERDFAEDLVNLETMTRQMIGMMKSLSRSSQLLASQPWTTEQERKEIYKPTAETIYKYQSLISDFSCEIGRIVYEPRFDGEYSNVPAIDLPKRSDRRKGKAKK